MKIGLDFDKTVFDTGGLVEELPVDLELFKNTFEKVYLSGNYTAERHAQELQDRGKEVSANRIKDVYSKAPNYLKTEVLEKASSKHCLFMVTRADTKGWQQQKIRAAAAEKYFHDIYIVYGDQPKDVPELDVLVDDNSEELVEVSEDTKLYDGNRPLEAVLAELN